MSYSSKIDADFLHYMESMVNLDALDRLTEDLGEELKDSQQVMNEIKGTIDTLPKNAQDSNPGSNFSGFWHKDISNSLKASPPKLLMPDMEEATTDVDLDDVLAMLKTYTEDIRKNIVVTEPATQVALVKRELADSQLEQYASSLDVLCKRLSSIKLGRKEEGNCNPDLESKLTVLCDDVNMLTQTVQAKTTLSETNKNCTATEQHNDALNYDQIINKLLSAINEVSYLLHIKN